MLTVDEISLPSDDSCEDRNSLNMQRIDMDLMDDLHDIIYRRVSVSSDNINSFGIEECLQDESCSVCLMFLYTNSFYFKLFMKQNLALELA